MYLEFQTVGKSLLFELIFTVLVTVVLLELKYQVQE